MTTGHFQTVKDVADMLKVVEAAVRRLIKDGDLRAFDVGRGWPIAPEDLEDFRGRHANRPHANEGMPTKVAGPARIACSPRDKRKID